MPEELSPQARSGSKCPPLLVVLHGVNLNLLGERPASHYGSLKLCELEAQIRERAASYGWRCVCHQTNHEGEFVELVHRYRQDATAFIVNPGAWTHYSYAIRDALEVVRGPIAEVHLSDITVREEWRRYSVLEDVATVRVFGKGPRGYDEAMESLGAHLRADE
jgi:3-dehydroquinate dehydratase-2